MNQTDRPPAHPVLQLIEFRLLLAAVSFSTLAARALAVVIGFQIWELTRSKMALGMLGLVEAIPALSLALFGGHVADRNDRRRIVLITQTVSVGCALLFAAIALNPHSRGIPLLYAVIFMAGVARGFADPAAAAFEAQVVPRALYVPASAWLSSAWMACAIVGPAVAGFSYDLLGVSRTYLLIAGLFAASQACIFLIAPKPRPVPPRGESIADSIAFGVRYVLRNQVLVGSMSLDLFAVLFGGAIAILPVFATDILHVGPRGLGFLNAAPSAGALIVTLWSTGHPPVRNAGRNLLLCVAGFGVAMIVFAFSTSFLLSLAALAAAGAFDGVSVVIRRAIVRLLSPEQMRGRISAVSSIFIGSSNELGAFESGVAASLLGTVRSVWLGGVATLLVVAVTAALAPQLRALHLDPEKVKPPET